MHRLIAALLISGLVANAQKTPQKPDLTVAPIAKLRRQVETTIKSTKPDYTVFIPQLGSEGVMDSGNEHFLVFDGPDGSLMTVWTQSTKEGEPDQHIVFAQS